LVPKIGIGGSLAAPPSWSPGKPSGAFVFRWQERGDPPVVASKRKGFGSAVLEQVMAGYFDEPPQIDFDPKGVCYQLVGSLGAIASDDTTARLGAGSRERIEPRAHTVHGIPNPRPQALAGA
jgi:hypothetical protein